MEIFRSVIFLLLWGCFCSCECAAFVLLTPLRQGSEILPPSSNGLTFSRVRDFCGSRNKNDNNILLVSRQEILSHSSGADSNHEEGLVIINPDATETTEIAHTGNNSNNYSRRTWLFKTPSLAVATVSFLATPRPSHADQNKLPSSLRDYTKLAPLGPSNNDQSVSNGKTVGLSPDEMARRLANDLVNGSNGRGGYFLSGDLSRDLFRDDCVFEDPTNRVNSLSQYQKALTLLFDPNRSTVELLGNGLSVQQVTNVEGDASTTTITGRLRSRGFLKVAPWNPYVKAYETTIVYTLDPSTGLVARQDQEWTKDATEALKETFTPSWNGSPPKSLRTKSTEEPQVVTALFDVLNGRRPNEYSREERNEIDARIEQIIAPSKSTSDTSSVSLAGTWVLVYLQPGPDGAGIDRRIPFFPEFDFNDSFQVFSSDDKSSLATNKVTNVGQLLGSLAEVRVSGSLRETTDLQSSTIRDFEATIEGGKLCFGNPSLPKLDSADNNKCPIDLPMIRGKGIFKSLYLGDRLRIGQNINGGGARVVQVRL